MHIKKKKKKFHLFIHQGKANQNFPDIPSHPRQNGCHKKMNNTNAGVDYALLVEM
jgi:hypothetical protein